jgi:hypothetical protein
MPRYSVTVSESRELTYTVEADTPDAAVERVGKLWCADAEPDDVDSSFDFSDAWEVE